MGKAGAGKGRSPTPTPNRDGGATTGGGGGGGGGSGGVGAAAPTATGGTTGVGRSTLHANKTILKTVSVFLASGKRNSSNQQSKAAAAALQNKRQQRQRRMDELSGKVNPKLLDSLRKKTRFTKDELDALCRIYRKLVSNCQYAAKTLASSSSSAAIAKPHAAVEVNACMHICTYILSRNEHPPVSIGHRSHCVPRAVAQHIRHRHRGDPDGAHLLQLGQGPRGFAPSSRGLAHRTLHIPARHAGGTGGFLLSGL
ncbi:uncharacterized protein Dyak_GE17486, isoform C [Drosophila yakuba]|uniref:Uncharacterized protein, isoform C n=1 Tax=Drosophila yakuba TaxID=7245 RepID=A0A0R1EB48_DROYA|nr:uncharacterized protein Dyak_GE17486, isoform C [Drosophila yakuba]